MISTQVLVDEKLYERAEVVAKRLGISLSELFRRSLEEVVVRERSAQPWMAYAGIIEGDEDDSSTVDEVVYGFETR